jgi:hypothetical protein
VRATHPATLAARQARRRRIAALSLFTPADRRLGQLRLFDGEQTGRRGGRANPLQPARASRGHMKKSEALADPRRCRACGAAICDDQDAIAHGLAAHRDDHRYGGHTGGQGAPRERARYGQTVPHRGELQAFAPNGDA